MAPALDEDLMTFLKRNHAAIRDGQAWFQNIPITYETRVTRFEVVASFVVVTLERFSRYYLVEQDPPGIVPLGYTLITLLLGWWGLPWGPICTIRAAIANLSGGKKCRVIDLIKDIPSFWSAVVLTERAARAAQSIMADRGFPPGSALRVDVTGKFRPYEYEITYDDQPEREGPDWVGQSRGIVILVSKKDIQKCIGLTIDFLDGRFTFEESPFSWSH
jgi:Fe-S cluster assembly iron-binding protein IscA